MQRHPPRAAAPAMTPAQPQTPAVAATVRRLDDGSIALIVADADAHRLDETTLLVRVATGARPEVVRARAELARGLRAFGDGPMGDAHASLLLATTLALRSPGAEPHLAFTAILAAADAAWSAGGRRTCLAALEAARSVLTATRAEADCTPLRDHLLGLRALLEQRPADAAGPLRRVLAHGHGDTDPETLHRAAVAALLLGEVENACNTGVRALAAARSRGRDDLVAQTLEHLAYAEMRTGHHARARAHAHEGLRAALRSGRSNTTAHHRAVLALTASVEGDTAEVAEQAALALATARRHGLEQTRTLAEWALARADLGRGRAEAAASRLSGLVRPDGGHFAVQPLLMPCFIEAAVLAGRPEEARPVTDALQTWAGFGIDRAAAAQLARCRALLATAGAPADTVDALYRHALELHTADIGDYERARTRLLYGNWLRRRRRPREARAVLREALHGFERCGARAGADQARAELRATGEAATVLTDEYGVLSTLTPHQLRIARHVATGATNREVAQAMSVSVRTVDHHLRNIFTALGIRSRVELARLVADTARR